MSNPDRDLVNDLWPHDEAGLREASLQRMIAEGRHRRGRRRALRGALCAAALLTAGVWLWRPPARLPAPGAPVASERAVVPAAPTRLTVRQLSAAEVEERLQGFAIAYVGGPGERKVVVLGEIEP